MSETVSKRAPRGSACLTCRRRKTKCDGLRPVCGPCLASSPGSCEYSDGAPSQDQLLQQQIAEMEGRLRDLQRPNDQRTQNNPSVELQSSYMRSPPQNIPRNVQQDLLRSFVPHSTNFGFFLDGSRFQSEQPSPALQSAMNLFGAYLNSSRELSALQGNLLPQALNDVSQGLSVSHPQGVLHTAQAEVLLAQYLFLQNRLLEAKYHITTAVSIVLGAGFHKIRSSSPRRTADVLPPPRDFVEEIERVNALWTVLILNHCWMSADGALSNISYDIAESRVDAPWPVDLPTRSKLPDDLWTSRTIQNFLGNTPDNAASLMALHAKAAILFEQASVLLRKYQPNMELRDAVKYQSTFNNLNQTIQRFLTMLPALNPNAPTALYRKQLVIHTLARISAIQLHYIFAAQDATSHSLIVSNAEYIVATLRGGPNLSEFPFIDPIMGVLWMATAKVFIEELGNAGPSSSSRRRPPRDLMSAIETIITVMSVFSPHSLLMGKCLPS
uniref:Zn(2)-C6 fungal-type domain-containing protein n=1 Tax=Moniliophthora roreri TaxID=221103 RepID=A0A0W0F8G0_MONRR